MKKNNGKILNTFIKYVSTNILGMIGISAYILADTFFISQGIGVDGLASLNIAIPAYSFMNGIGLMLGIGGATRYSILLAGKNVDKAHGILTHSVVTALFFSIIFMCLGGFFSDELSTLLGATNEICDMTSQYIRTMLLFAPLFMLNNVLIAFVRNDGSPNIAMSGMLIGSFANIILDYIFVFPLKMGMFGAALATCCAPIVSIGILSIHLFSKKSKLRVGKTAIKIKTIFDIFSLGASSFIVELSIGCVMILFNIILIALSGNIAVAAYGVIANIALVISAMFTGIAQGIQPIVSKNYGMNQLNNVRKIYFYGIITAIFIAISSYIFSYFFAPELVGIFNKDNNEEMTKIAVNGIKIYFIGFAFSGINIISAMFFSSVDKPKQSFSISMLRGLITIVPTVIIFSQLIGINGVWMSFPVAEMITFIFTVSFMIVTMNKIKKAHDNR